jgi:hypothetical protein
MQAKQLSDNLILSVFAFGRQQSCLPKAYKALFDPTPLTDFIEIGS